jgi:lipopolysaccharide export system protein LptC
LIKNKQTGLSNDFGIVQCYSAEDAEYLLRVIESPEFNLNGYKVNAALSKLNRESFNHLYGATAQTETTNDLASQQQYVSSHQDTIKITTKVISSSWPRRATTTTTNSTSTGASARPPTKTTCQSSKNTSL